MLRYLITCRYKGDTDREKLLFYSNGDKSVFSATPYNARIYNTPKEATEEIKRLKNIYPSLVINYDEVILNIQK